MSALLIINGVVLLCLALIWKTHDMLNLFMKFALFALGLVTLTALIDSGPGKMTTQEVAK